MLQHGYFSNRLVLHSRPQRRRTTNRRFCAGRGMRILLLPRRQCGCCNAVFACSGSAAVQVRLAAGEMAGVSGGPASLRLEGCARIFNVGAVTAVHGGGGHGTTPKQDRHLEKPLINNNDGGRPAQGTAAVVVAPAPYKGAPAKSVRAPWPGNPAAAAAPGGRTASQAHPLPQCFLPP